MQHREFHFEGMNGCSLYAQSWLPEVSPRAAVVIVHGIGEHSGRYANVVDHLVSEQIGVYGYDHRGHGNSPGQRGHIGSWMEYRTDLLNFLNAVRAEQPDSRMFVFGQSMGALIVLDFIHTGISVLTGAVVSTPPIEPVGVSKPLKVMVAGVLSRVIPRFPIDLGLDPEAISRIPSVVCSYRSDPLVQGKITARWGTEILSAIEFVKSDMKEIGIPLLMIHGEADSLHSIEGSQRFFDQIQASDKEFIGYPGGYHELHNDLDSEVMLNDLLDWINRHL